MKLRVLCPGHGLLVFAAGFSVYFFMKYYLMSVAVVFRDEKESHFLSQSITTVPTYTAVNDSFYALFGNQSCQTDFLDAPEFLRAAGCNDGICETVTCQRLLVGDKQAVDAAVKFTNTHDRKVLQESEVLNNALNCEEFRTRGGYWSRPVRPSDKEFPIAFSILVHWHLEQFERLLRAIYRPQNVYCIHVDAKASSAFHSAIAAIARCLDNVYIATKSQFIVYAGFSRLQVRVTADK